MNLWHLDYWKSGEWQVVQERLNDLKRDGIQVCPASDKRFEALRRVPRRSCRVAIIGQDPYPNPRHATGIAFDVPKETEVLPPSLVNIFDELRNDLGIVHTSNPSLAGWVDQGVLLWNCYPTCTVGKPGSHRWLEYDYLTREIIEKLDEQEKNRIVFCFLGSVAARFADGVNNGLVISTSHPSPLGVNHGFKGSKIFSRINSHLEVPINWGL